MSISEQMEVLSQDGKGHGRGSPDGERGPAEARPRLDEGKRSRSGKSRGVPFGVSGPRQELRTYLEIKTH